jgi:hypothetical protein
MKINPNLIWDYTIPEARRQDEAFRRWYVGRVLQRGGVQDIRSLGVSVIRRYLPQVSVPKRIRAFWKWYFKSVHGQRSAVHPHTFSSQNPRHAR